MKKLILFLVSAFLLAACSAGSVGVGDKVLANWGGDDGWFKASVTEACEGGWFVDFENDFYDASSKRKRVCYEANEIVVDEAPRAGKIEVGTRLLAEDEGSFYPASVVEIHDDGTYTAAYLSNLNQISLNLDQLRLNSNL